MTKNAFVFPYTLQYVGKLPYIYELKNVFLFGIGPLISFFAFIGINQKELLAKAKAGKSDSEILKWIRAGNILDSKSVAGILYYATFLARSKASR